MRQYGLKGGVLEALKGACFPCALAQQALFLTMAERKGFLRFPWETAEKWKVPSTEVETFDVVVVGSSGAGVTSLVRACVGAPRPHGGKKKDAEVKKTREFSVGLRLIKLPGHPLASLRFWDLPCDAAATLPEDQLRTADAVVLVFNADLYASFESSIALYDSLFKDHAGVKILLGNVHADRAQDDTCEFMQNVDDAATQRGMAACMLAAHTHSAQGSKRLVDTILKAILQKRRQQKK